MLFDCQTPHTLSEILGVTQMMISEKKEKNNLNLLTMNQDATLILGIVEHALVV